MNWEASTEAEKQLSVTLREFLFPNLPPGQIASSKAVAKRLKAHVGEPVRRGEKTLILKTERNSHTEVLDYYVEV